MDSLINIQDPMNVVKYWDRDAKQERILAIKKANESLWGCLAKAVWVTSPSYVGKLDDEDTDKLQKKIEDPKNAFDNRMKMINFQVVTQKNGKLSKKWFALGMGMVLFGIGLVVAGTMVGELSQFGASLIKSNLGIAVTSVIFYSAVCVGAFWRSRFLHTKNYDARKGVIEKLTGKSYEEKPWWIFGTSRALTTNQEVKSRIVAAEDIPVSRYSGSRGRYNTEDTDRFIEELRQTAAECEQERRAGSTGGRYG